MGIAGISRPGVRDALADFAFPFASVAYETAAFIANLGAHGGADGALLLLGAGSIAAGGTLGMLIPPSIMLVVMGPVVGVPIT